MEFHIYENGQWREVTVEVQPQLTITKDTTNDAFSCALKATTRKLPYKPMTPFKITYDDETEQIMWIISDSVAIFSNVPLTYKHTLSLVQYRYFLNKHLLRDTICTQPRVKEQQFMYSISSRLNVTDYHNKNSSEFWQWGGNFIVPLKANGTPVSVAEPCAINHRSRVKKFKSKIEVFAVANNGAGSHHMNGKMKKFNSIDEIVDVTSDAVIFELMDQNNNRVAWLNFQNHPFNNFYENQTITDEINEQLALGSDLTLKLRYKKGGYTTFDNGINASFITGRSGSRLATAKNFIVTIQVTISVEMYNYNMYELLETLINQYKLTDDAFGSKREQLFYLPEANSTGQEKELYDLLTTTFPPDTMAFTQATWYEVLETIFNFYDAGFKFDENKKIQIDYYNDIGGQVAKSMAGRTMDFGDKDFNNGKICYYQNSIENVKIKSIPTRCAALGIPGQQDYAIVLPKPIYNINKLEFTGQMSLEYMLGDSSEILAQDLSYTNVDFDFMQLLDLTKLTVAEEIWTLLHREVFSHGYNPNNILQDQTLFFKRGTNEINVSKRYKSDFEHITNSFAHVLETAICRFFGNLSISDAESSTDDNFTKLAVRYKDQYFNIDYDSQEHGRMQVETLTNKYKGESIVNQNASMVNLNKLGLRILSESLKDGEPSMTCTCEFTDWENRIVPGNYFTDADGLWVANVVSYRALQDGKYQATIEFTKNFNLKALRVNSDKEKRLTAISGELGTISEDNYIDYIYVTDINHSPERESIVLNQAVIESMVGQTFGIDKETYAPIKAIDLVNIQVFSKDNQQITNKLACPMITYGAGNCVCFEMQYDSPINAGNQLVVDTGWFSTTDAYFSQVTKYTDDEGWAEKITIHFCSQVLEVQTNYPVVVESVTITTPFIDPYTITVYEVAGSIEKLQYNKKPNETFALNYEWCFLPLPSEMNDFFIGSKFINENAFTSLFKAEGTEFYLYYSFNEEDRYSILDTVANTTNRVKIAVRTDRNDIEHFCGLGIIIDENAVIDPDHPQVVGINVKTWSICDSKGNIYFASNHPKTFWKRGPVEWIYFITKRHRMADDDELEGLPVFHYPTTVSFTIRPENWFTVPAVDEIELSHVPTGESDDPVVYFISDNERGATWSYSLELRSLAGKTMQSGYPQISQDSSSGYTNTVSFDNNYQVQNPVTHQWETFGRFYGTITKVPFTTGDEIKATLVYAIVGQTGFSEHYYSVSKAFLIGKTLSNITITPASDAEGKTNTIIFDSTTGTFRGRVYRSTEPSEPVTYTISYTIVS